MESAGQSQGSRTEPGASSTRVKIFGDGEMADLTRAFAWEQGPLGPADSWSDVLVSTVNTLLGTKTPMFLWWGDDLIQFYNDSYRQSLGSDKHPKALGQPGIACWPEIWHIIGPEVESVRQQGLSTWHEDQLVPIHREGVLVDAYWTYSYSPVREIDGTIRGVLVSTTETTERIDAERRSSHLLSSLKESEERVRLAIDGAGLASWFFDPATSIVGGDAKMSHLFGLSVLEGPAEIWLAAVHPDDRERVGAEFAASIEGKPYDTEYRVCRDDGTVRWVRARAQLVTMGFNARMLGICEDFTDRKRVEQQLTETAARLSLAQQAGKLAAWEWEIATGKFTWDEGSWWSYGRSPSEMTHVDIIYSYLHEDDRERVNQELQPALNGTGDFRSEFRVIWPDGSLHWIQAFGKTVLSEEGKPVSIFGMNMNVTERKLSEKALLQTEKLAAVGRLASSISHEINNPLESVTNLLYLARTADPNPILDQYLADAERELRRVSAITNQTLRFYKQTTGPRPVGCSELFQETLTLYQGRLVNSNIVVEKRKRANRPAFCFEGEIRQVLSNLIANAIDAMPRGGRLILRSREATDWQRGEKGLALTVADTGAGMPAAVQNRIFEAFFSTKGIGGTGLGLWVSKELIEKHRGKLRVRSLMGDARHGTVFSVFIPFEGKTEKEPSQTSV